MALPKSLFRRSLKEWGLLVAFWGVVGLVFVGYNYLIHLFTERPFPQSLVFWIVIGWAIWIPLTPIVVWLASQYPIARSRWVRGVLRHLGMASLIVLLDVTIFVAIRAFALAVAGHAGPEPLITGEDYTLARLFRDVLLRSFFFDILIYAVIVAVVHALDYYKRYQERALQTAQLEAQLAQAQVQALRMQLNPHFLFNTLHTVSFMIDEDAAEARSLIADLSGLLRQALDESDEQEHSLEEELAFLRRYLKIEETRFQDRLTVQFDVADDTRGALVPNLILQPLVENALKHGIAPYAKPGTIIVRSRREDDKLLLRVEDSGPGIQENTVMRGRVGLKNTEERLKQMYGPAQHFSLCNLSGGGFCAEIEIPFTEEALPVHAS